MDLRKGKCKLTDFSMFSFRTFDNCYAELWFGTNTLFEFKEQSNGNFLLERKGMTLSIPRSSFERLKIVSEEIVEE